MAAKDAKIQPIYGCKYRALFQFLDANGDPAAASSAAAVLSKDSADYAALDDTVHEVGTATGLCYVDLLYTETQYKQLKLKATSTGAIAHIEDLFPQRLPVLRSGTAQAGAAATMTLDSGASDKDDAYVGCYLRCSNNTPAGVQGDCHKIISYVGSTKVATVDANWADTPTSSTTFEILLSGELSIVSLLTTLAKLQSSLGIPKNQAFSNLPFPMLGTDTNEPKTGLSLTVQRVLDDGSLGAFAGTSNEIGSSGIYRINPAAADLNGKVCSFVVTASGAKTRVVTIITAD